MPADAISAAIRKLAHGGSLDARESADAFDEIMRGDALPSQIAALLMALRVKGETAEEVAGAARALRRAMNELQAKHPEALVDTCGTGGGTLQTFNISTAAALLAAGAGVRVAKHGNRSFTSRSGSADVLEALGIRMDVTSAEMEVVLERAGIVFMFAPAMHPAMRHVGPVRRELAVPTVMNVLGPLANPAGARRQVIGVADPSRLALLSGALRELGALHALVVHGAPGMDEISPLGPTTVHEVRDGRTDEWTIEPADLGIGAGSAADLAGGSPDENAAMIEEILAGGGKRSAVDAVLLNTAAAIYVAGNAPDLPSAMEVARSAHRSAAGTAALGRLRVEQGKPAGDR